MASPGSEPRRARSIDVAGPESVWAAPVDLHERLLRVCGGTTYADLSRLTGTHRESVRRFLKRGKPPSAAFLAALCSAGQISAEWLLCGRGRPLYTDPDSSGLDAAADLAAIQAQLGRAISAHEGGRPRRSRARASGGEALGDSGPD